MKKSVLIALISVSPYALCMLPKTEPDTRRYSKETLLSLRSKTPPAPTLPEKLQFLMRQKASNSVTTGTIPVAKEKE